ncbi:hydrolase [Jannaschia pagri]|uniref:Hydrolase n=1 Tax=Jannaschia pagri TaxID=2829797 RepID=A0ABQ4NJH2_9RHOB|nr:MULTISPECIES: HAD-IA family hydrolase [unclassified Jannaschia]GIT90654.1 hydrolase [Jannaschia sp. AI_61]GIT94486.1 hydrolase [Jannaschia sp. AI_62]
MALDTVVFDIGAVLVDWQPHLAWSDDMTEAEARAFLARIGFDKLNLACDAGATFAEAAALITDPEDAARLTGYVDRFTRTVPHKLLGTWDLLYRLRDRGVALHAITNWSAETWPEGVKAHPELGQVFGTTIVSGQEGMIKPSVQIFHRFCTEAGVRPESCVFIDDGLHNCLGARAAGLDAIHFTGAEALETALVERGLL